jgi:hypothetical protein
MALPIPRLQPVTIACLSCNPRSMAFSPLLECRASVVPLPLFSLRELGARLARCFILDVSTRAPTQKPPIRRSGGSLACPAITPPASSASTGFVQRPTPSCSPQAARSEPQNASGSSSHTGSAGRSASAQPPPAILPLPRARARARVLREIEPNSLNLSRLPKDRPGPGLEGTAPDAQQHRRAAKRQVRQRRRV